MFSLKRYLNLFIFDFYHNKKLYFYFFISIFVALILIHFFVEIFGSTFFFYFIFNDKAVLLLSFGIIFYIVSIYRMFDHYKSIHDVYENIFYLSLPVSTLERYLFVLVQFLFILPLFLVSCFYTSLNLILLLVKIFHLGIKVFYFSPYHIVQFFGSTYVVYLIMFSMFLLSRIMFKSYPFFKAMIIGSIFSALLIIFFYFVIFFVDGYLFKIKCHFIFFSKRNYFLMAIFMLFSGFIYSYAYFLLKNLGNFNIKFSLSISLRLVSFFAILFFLLLGFLSVVYIYYC
ncbi:ABC transporter permease [Borrelia sp. HM]|uniref:ABC transporter permease n=1 Tax=Borrelia sp. HM TaxID=1882662 RepID=UPI001C76A4B0|nr:ABC transporter permease [Borrelia sp. HM]BCR21993.1 hypothetical protein BKFM_00574 [Borrelia sp. HM]